jgi:uncharacterized membrane protein
LLTASLVSLLFGLLLAGLLTPLSSCVIGSWLLSLRLFLLALNHSGVLLIIQELLKAVRCIFYLLNLLRLNVFAADTCRLDFRLNFGLWFVHQRILYRETQLFRNNLEHVSAVSILLQTFSLERGLGQINDDFSMAFGLHHESHMVNDFPNFRL